MKTKLKTILGAITLGLCLIPFIIVGIRRSQTNSIIQDKSLSGFITVKPIYSKFLRPAGDIKDFRDYIELVRKNTFIKTIGAEKKQLLQEGIQEDLDLIVDEALPYITRTLSSIGLNRTARPKVSFVDKFLGVYPSTMRNFLSGNYIEGMYNPVYNQLEINAVDSSKLRRNELKETVTHELIHSQYPGLPFFLWYKIPLFADESFVTVATLETLADQALHGDQLAKSTLLITLIKKIDTLIDKQENKRELSRSSRVYDVIPIKTIISVLNGHTRGYKGLSLDSMVEFLDREIEEIDEKYQGYLNERILEKYCLNPDTEFECLGPIKNITLIPGNTFPTSKIRLYYQIDNITGLYSKFINNYNYDSGKANLLPIQLHIGGQFNKEIYPQPLLILHDAFGKIITVQIPKKQGAYLVEKTNSPIKTTVRYERSFSKTIENIKD